MACAKKSGSKMGMKLPKMPKMPKAPKAGAKKMGPTTPRVRTR